MNELMRLEPLVGNWDVTLTHAWFLDSLDTEIHGAATVEWYADAFLLLRGEFPGRTPEQGGSAWWMAFARNDPRDSFVALYHDDRGVSRVFDMTFADGEWTLLRDDPDFHQRIVMRLGDDRLDWRAEASDDAGRTWRKDLDYIFTRRTDVAPIQPLNDRAQSRQNIRR
jgi:hypothetical protein